ncbi:MAG TPA: hypothetical protein VGD56_12350 [Gemmatirosa sp.]
MNTPRARVSTILRTYPDVAVAVSGGVDSVSLAAAACEVLGTERVLLFHAVSPAVPPEATARVRHLAARAGWHLSIVDAGEFADAEYLRNPVDRCYHCKTHLYRAFRARTDRLIVSGTNRDDLGEYRPGLTAAREWGVRHPFVEAELGKSDVRELARELGLSEVADLPASPCLASRVETGIAITPSTLRLVHEVEALVGDIIEPAVVRCRIRARVVVIELDTDCLDRLEEADRAGLLERVVDHLTRRGRPRAEIALSEYRVGSAFLTT